MLERNELGFEGDGLSGVESPLVEAFRDIPGLGDLGEASSSPSLPSAETGIVDGYLTERGRLSIDLLLWVDRKSRKDPVWTKLVVLISDHLPFQRFSHRNQVGFGPQKQLCP